mmetsp:Transcript_5880/g.13409  ORF Transcript_5880/g.13409 Transcript_5880/m.13409 type:complete len:828 (-) Transcript_5880:174-2657(-)|eukprot:CAMPEP_0172314724 /NCGR_PEP_ID=MMETSP1058-20130122/23254_1 /TAXON_ID=83371 /ORGANISM="Detonula confervacea, Strain CCMP 353" /LENGTH=827 /DNA_ID=CAMNT_0013028663 /DNA_START=131 /DNA_END=2614 /DNA_ORIENTATION=-
MSSSSTTASAAESPSALSRIPSPNPTLVRVAAFLVVVALVATIGAGTPQAFRACLGALLSLFGCAQLYVAVKLFQNRHNLLLELSQPVGLSIFAGAAAIATVAPFLFALPESDVGCALRQPIIFTSISLMGGILVARSWRIGCIVSPHHLHLRRRSQQHSMTFHNNTTDTLKDARLNLMRVLSKLSGWALFVGSCGKCKAAGNNGIRQQITFADSVRVLAVLMMPQIILQTIILSVPALRMEIIEIDDSVYACQCSAGPALLIVGAVFAVTPFFIALLLNVKPEGLPEIFQEYDQIASSMRTSIGVLLITLPTIAMISDTVPNAHAYLTVASTLSFVLPTSYNITFPWIKSCYMITKKNENPTSKRKYSSVTVARSSSLGNSSSNVDKLDVLQTAESALAMGKMFQNMGRFEKAIEVNNDVLSMFKGGDGEYDVDDGYTESEISSFGPKTLQVVVSTLISSTKYFSISTYQNETRDEYIRKAGKSCIDALHIFENASAKNLLKDRSVVFPGYSCLLLLIKGDKINVSNRKDQSPAEFDNAIAANFVNETRFTLFHHCRALAMKADILARHQKFDDALLIVEEMKMLYDSKMHSKAIAVEYENDWCAVTISLSSLWLYHLDRVEEASNQCEYLIERILPQIEKEHNMLGALYCFFPLTQILTVQGHVGASRALGLLNDHIAEPLHNGVGKGSLARLLIREMVVLLKCRSLQYDSVMYDEIEDDIAWMIDREEKIPDYWIRIITNTISWSWYSLLAEICLHLAKRPDTRHEQKTALIEEGLRLSGLAESKMEDDATISSVVISYASHPGIYSELRLRKISGTDHSIPSE